MGMNYVSMEEENRVVESAVVQVFANIIKKNHSVKNVVDLPVANLLGAQR